MQILKSLFLLLITASTAFAQVDGVYVDEVMLDNVKSVQMITGRGPAIVPIISLQGGRFTLSFDQLTEDANELYYKIIHCDRDWKKSDLEEIEYLDGFNGEEIRNYQFSNNIYSDYVHFKVSIPNEDTRLRISGNYAIIIYEDEALESPILVKRFLVKEKKVNVFAQVVNNTDVRRHDTHHQLKVEIEPLSNDAADPMKDYSIDVIANARWDHSLLKQYPKFTARGRLIFDRNGAISLPAGNEFRSFDTRTLQYARAGVKNIHLQQYGTVVSLHGDHNKRHYYDDDLQDFDGRFAIENLDRDDSDISSEYTQVHFGLIADNPVADNVYLLGAFNQWKKDKNSKMKFVEDQGYRYSTKLKQGVYNYIYATDDEDPVFGDHALIEGNHVETINYYTVLVYMRDRALGFDRLVGTSQIQSFDRFR